jgi:hypothetical protein
MPWLSPDDRRAMLGPRGPCPHCGQIRVRHYCRSHDEFFDRCTCAPSSDHAACRIYCPYATDLSPLNIHARCPDCTGRDFVIGPTAGRAWNVKCFSCGSKFWYAPPFPPERVDNADALYTAAPVTLAALWRD